MTEANQHESPLRDEHFRAFGAIVHLFARHESLMTGAIASLMGVREYQARMLTSELPYRGKRETLLAMINDSPSLTQETKERLQGYLGQLHKWNKLRNDIAHSVWREGSRPDSVKALSLSIRGGSLSHKGVDPEEKDYTAQDLIDLAVELMRLHTRFTQYLLSIDLLPNANDG